MFKQLLVTTASAATIMLAACGGGGGADVTPPTGGGGNPPPPAPAQAYRVAGPLDVVQGPVSSTVFGQLQSATDGTPLEGVLVCADHAVNYDALDIADTVANALQNAAASGASNAAALAATAASLNSSVNQLANDLQGLLNALAGSGGCGSNGQPVGALGGTNPLAGTPLAPLGTELASVLFSIRSAHPGSGGTTLPLSTLATLTGQLSNQIDAGIAAMLTQAPAVSSTPILNGVLFTVQQMLHDVDGLMQAVSQLDTVAVRAGLNTLVGNVLSNELSRVVPLRAVEQQGAQVGLFSTPVQLGAADVADLFAGSLGTLTTQALKLALVDEFEPTLLPIADEVLPVLSTQIVGALFNAGSATGPTGTPLDSSLGAVTTLLGPVGGVGQPVSTVLSLVVGAVQSGAGGTPLCPSTNPLLNLLCGL